MESGLTCYLFFVPSMLPYLLPEFGFPNYIIRTYPIIPLPSLRQFLQKLVLHMLCFKYVPVPNRSKFYTSASQTYLSELLDRWNTSDDFAIPYYHVILDTITAGQSILMMSPPPADQLTTLGPIIHMESTIIWVVSMIYPSRSTCMIRFMTPNGSIIKLSCWS